MPRRSIPKYSLHRPTNQARVRIGKRDIYLGVYGTPESHQRYTEALADWQQSLGEAVDFIDVGTLSRLYLHRCKKYYVKNGVPTGEATSVKIALRHLNRKYRSIKVEKFDVLKLKAVREAMTDHGYARKSINQHISRIRTMFKWGVSERLVPQSVWVELTSLQGLKFGRTRAKEPAPVTTVPESHIEAVKPFVTSVVWDMISLQRVTGMRPGEVVKIRLSQLDRSGEIWIYTPMEHKTAHHKKQRVILIGKKGQQILTPLLDQTSSDFIFDPNRGREEFTKNNYRSGAKTRVRNNRESYSIHGYGCAIKRACEKAGIERWTPNQLRHNFATEARRSGGIESSRILLGHSSAVTSEIYAEADLDSVMGVISKIG